MAAPQLPLIVVWSENKLYSRLLIVWLRNSVLSLMEICHQRSKWLGPKCLFDETSAIFLLDQSLSYTIHTSIPWIRSWPKCAKVVFPIMCEGHSRQLLAHSRCATSTSGNKNRKKGGVEIGLLNPLKCLFYTRSALCLNIF